MSTQEQAEANRRNGSLSNGPKTTEGKDKSSKNALKHGLLSREVLLPEDDATEFGRYEEGLERELNPKGEFEYALVARIIGLMWRLRRAGGLEAGILYWQRCMLAKPLEPLLYQCASPLGNFRTFCGERAYRESVRPKVNAREYAQKANTTELASSGEAYINGENSLAKLSRYESALQRNLIRLLHELQRLQATRKGEHVPPPAAVDIDVTGLPEPTGVEERLAAEE